MFKLLLPLYFAAVSFPASAQLTLAIVRGDNEYLGDLETHKKYDRLSQIIQDAAGEPVKVKFYRDAFFAIKRGKAGEFDMVLGPSQVAANLIKVKYSPLLKSVDMVTAVYVTPRGSGTGSLQDARGMKVGMPHYESLTGGLARAQLNEMGISGKKYFAELHYQPVSEATLYGLNIGRYDVAVADADMAQAWVKKNGGKIIAKTSTSPSMAFSVKESLNPSQADKIKNAMLNHDSIRFASAEKSEFKKIGSMLNTTPTALPGTRVVQAAQAKILIGQGIPVYDVRMKEEFQDGHIPGAIHVPYNESSAKEPEFDGSSDSFELDKLPQDKKTAIIMYCDGTTCWKSYKSAIMATKNGWENIIWFRGGFPEWKAAGYSVESGKPNKTASK